MNRKRLPLLDFSLAEAYEFLDNTLRWVGAVWVLHVDHADAVVLEVLILIHLLIQSHHRRYSVFFEKLYVLAWFQSIVDVVGGR